MVVKLRERVVIAQEKWQLVGVGCAGARGGIGVRPGNGTDRAMLIWVRGWVPALPGKEAEMSCKSIERKLSQLKEQEQERKLMIGRLPRQAAEAASAQLKVIEDRIVATSADLAACRAVSAPVAGSGSTGGDGGLVVGGAVGQMDPGSFDPRDFILDELVDEVPTAFQDGDTALDWSVTPMPAPDRVVRFLDALSVGTVIPIDVGEFSTTATPTFNKWWRGFEASDAPLDNWAQPLTAREQTLIDRACPVLSCELWAQLIRAVKDSGVYPPEWGSSELQFRATGDRFFDRLRLTFLSPMWFTPEDVSRRRADWTSHSGERMDPQTTIFARRHEDNAFHGLQLRLASGGSTLGALVGLTDVPDEFAFPLMWSEAVYSGLAEDTSAELPDDLKNRLRGFADDIDAALGGADDVTFWARLAGVGLLLSSISLPAGGLALLAAGVSDSLSDAIAHWPAALRRAAATDATLDDVAYELLHMLRTTNYDGVFENVVEDALGLDEKVLFVGLTHREVLDLERALRPGVATFDPMILLGDAFAEYAIEYGRTPLEFGGADLKAVIPSQRLANGLWTAWWNSAKPTLDVAYVLETIGIAAQQMLHLDDALLALESLANGEGMIAATLRSSIAEQDQAAFADALGGVSLSGGVRHLLRQSLTDLFIDWVSMDEVQHDVPEAERADHAGIHSLLPWMSSSAKRAAIDDALGPVIEVNEENAGELWTAFQVVRSLLGYSTLRHQIPLEVRGWLLPDAPSAQRGAFGRMLSALAASATSDLPAPEITLADLGLIREWLTHARQSDLVDRRAELEPWWTLSSDPVDIPSDLPTDGGDVQDHGPLGPLGP